MQLLKDKILKLGKILPNQVLKVDNFLNHRIDTALIYELGRDFYNHFKNKRIDKILTIESSGIAIAFATALFFNVPIVFAKKAVSNNLSNEIYTQKIHSFTKNTDVNLVVAKEYLVENENILIIDDFLATGSALIGLIDILNEAKANLVGVGIVIEKGFQNGGDILRNKNIDVYSQAIIKEFKNNSLIFKD